MQNTTKPQELQLVRLMAASILCGKQELQSHADEEQANKRNLAVYETNVPNAEHHKASDLALKHRFSLDSLATTGFHNAIAFASRALRMGRYSQLASNTMRKAAVGFANTVPSMPGQNPM